METIAVMALWNTKIGSGAGITSKGKQFQIRIVFRIAAFAPLWSKNGSRLPTPAQR